MTTPEGLERLAHLTPAEAQTWRAAYWAEVARGGVEVAGKVFLDKAPAGTLYLPLIAKLFPGAKILFALRDPRDVVLSCLRSSFQDERHDLRLHRSRRGGGAATPPAWTWRRSIVPSCRST